MPIKGLSEQIRMPRIGKIHLGIKVTNKQGVEYPKAVDYFVFPEKDALGGEHLEQLVKEFGEKPKELQIIFPIENVEGIASQYYRCYSKSRGLICRGDGETCMRLIDISTGDLPTPDSVGTTLKEMPCKGKECPDYGEKCREVMNLQFMLPKISGLGVWQIDTSSINSIRNINSSLEMIRSVYGKLSMIPLVLAMESIEVTPPNIKKKTVHVLNIRSMDSVIEALIKAKKPPLELIAGKADVEQAERDIKELWGGMESDRMLSPEESAERMTTSEITEAEAVGEAEPVKPEPAPAVKPEAEAAPKKDESKVTEIQASDLLVKMQEKGMTMSAFGLYCNKENKWGITKIGDLKVWQYEDILTKLEKGKD